MLNIIDSIPYIIFKCILLLNRPLKYDITIQDLIKAGTCVTDLYIDSISINDLQNNEYHMKSTVGETIPAHKFHPGIYVNIYSQHRYLIMQMTEYISDI